MKRMRRESLSVCQHHVKYNKTTLDSKRFLKRQWKAKGIVRLQSMLYQEKFEDTEGIIRSRKSKDRQYNGQQKKGKQWYI